MGHDTTLLRCSPKSWLSWGCFGRQHMICCTQAASYVVPLFSLIIQSGRSARQL